jgi:hypothetical protein
LRELGIGWIPAYSPQAKGRVERSFATDQDRLVKQLRLARVKTMQAANEFLEKEYWPEWNERFAASGRLHRPAPATDERARPGIGSELRRRACHLQRLHLLVRRAALSDRPRSHGCGNEAPAAESGTGLDGSLWARYAGRWLEISECTPSQKPAKVPAVADMPVKKNHNAGGNSSWMDAFFEQPVPPLWLAIGNAGERNR